MNAMSIALNVRYWILAAIVIGFIVGDVFGEYDAIMLIVFLMVMMCFSLTKMQFVKDDLAHYRKYIFVSIFLCSVVATVVTLGVGLLYPKQMWEGWVILACVPCAISVVSGTMFMKGDGKLIMISLSVIYLLAIVLTPLLSYLLIDGDSAVDPMEIVKYVILFIVIPLIVSVPLKKAGIPDDANSLIINFTFFMFALIAIGRSRDFFFDDIGMAMAVIGGTAIRIAVVHLVFEYTSRHVGVPRENRIPFSLLLIWRNSGLALALVLLLFQDNKMAMAPASISMIFEQFYFMFMMWYYERIVPPSSEAIE